MLRGFEFESFNILGSRVLGQNPKRMGEKTSEREKNWGNELNELVGVLKRGLSRYVNGSPDTCM